MGKLKLVYRGRLPAMNEIIGANRRNFYMGNKLKQKTQNDIIAQFLPQKRGTEFQKKVNMRIWFYEPNQRRDEDNVKSGLKFLLDALQEIKILKSDSPKYLHIASDEVFVDRENPRIEIEIKEAHRQMMCDDRYSKKDKDLKVPKHCEVCGEVFIPFEIIDDTSFRGWDICSLKCLDIWADLKKQKITKHCEFCGKEFQTIVISKKTCSDNCRKKLSLRNRKCGNE